MPRPRFISESQRDTPVARHRAVTLLGTPATLRLAQSSRTDPDMQKNLIHGLEKPIKDFVGLNTRVQAFATDWAAYVADFKSLPPPAPLDPDSPVGKPPSAFPSAEDYAFFSLNAIIVTHLYNRIFRHFHPAASDTVNTARERAYQRQREISKYPYQPFSAIR